MNLFPTVSTTDVNGTFALLAFLSDPKGCAARLQELKVASDEAQAKIDAAGFAKAEIAEAKVKADKDALDISNQYSNLNVKTEAYNTSKAKLDQDSASFNAKITETTSVLNSRSRELDAKESDLVKREKTLERNALKVQNDSTKAEELKSIYETKLAQLKSAIS